MCDIKNILRKKKSGNRRDYGLHSVQKTKYYRNLQFSKSKKKIWYRQVSGTYWGKSSNEQKQLNNIVTINVQKIWCIPSTRKTSARITRCYVNYFMKKRQFKARNQWGFFKKEFLNLMKFQQLLWTFVCNQHQQHVEIIYQ